MIKWWPKYKRDIITGTAVGLFLALAATFVPVQVSITSEGFLAVDMNVALATQVVGDYPTTVMRASPGFPQVAAVNGGNDYTGTDHTVNLPANIDAGELFAGK